MGVTSEAPPPAAAKKKIIKVNPSPALVSSKPEKKWFYPQQHPRS